MWTEGYTWVLDEDVTGLPGGGYRVAPVTVSLPWSDWGVVLVGLPFSTATRNVSRPTPLNDHDYPPFRTSPVPLRVGE